MIAMATLKFMFVQEKKANLLQGIAKQKLTE